VHLKNTYTLKMEVNNATENLVLIYNTTLRYIPEYRNGHVQCHENLKSYTCPAVLFSLLFCLSHSTVKKENVALGYRRTIQNHEFGRRERKRS
jgi:hypothetical protein